MVVGTGRAHRLEAGSGVERAWLRVIDVQGENGWSRGRVKWGRAEVGYEVRGGGGRSNSKSRRTRET